MLKVLFALFVLLILVGGGVGMYFLWRPKKKETCDWEDRECNYAQGCINQACIDKDGKVLQNQCLEVQRCQTPPVCEEWQDIGCDTANQCMRQECVTDESERQCVDSAKCQKTPIAKKCPANTVLKGEYCYSVCPSGTIDKGDYCEITIDNFKCPASTVSVGPAHQGVPCYKRKYDPKTQRCIPEWINAACDPKTHERTQINSCTSEERDIAGTSKDCCPVWKSLGCDHEKYCTKLTDECGKAADRCVCGSFGGKQYSECCPKYKWDYVGGYLKNTGMNDYARGLTAGGYDAFLSFNKQDQPVIFQPAKLTGYLYTAVPFDVGGGKTFTEYGYLILGGQIDKPCTVEGKNICGGFTPQVDKAYSLKMTTDPQQQKSVWAYNRITGELVDNISDPKIKLSVIAMANQAGLNPRLLVAAVPYTNPKSNYDIWLYEYIISQ